MTTVISFDAGSYGSGSWSHTAGAGAQVAVVMSEYGVWGANPTPYATYDGESMTLAGSARYRSIATTSLGGVYYLCSAMFYIGNIPTGTSTVTATWSSGGGWSQTACCGTWKNCMAPTTGYSNIGPRSGVSVAGVVVADGELVVDGGTNAGTGGGSNVIQTAGQTNRVYLAPGGYWDGACRICDEDTGAGTQTQSYYASTGGDGVGVSACVLRKASAGGSPVYFWFKRWNSKWRTWKERESGLIVPRLDDLVLPHPERVPKKGSLVTA